MGFEEISVETMKMGVTCAVFAILFACLIPVATISRHWFVEAENRNSQTGYLETLSDAYMLEQKKEVSGNDIVEFILKNDARYDYYITVNGNTYPVTVKKSESLMLSGKNSNIWSENYLMDNIFIRNTIYDSYSVVPVRSNDETIAYKFYQK